MLGLVNYKFVGVFINDREKSNPEIGTVWKRIADNIDLQTGEFKNGR